jgi:membrane protein DedA with SNARE-associated domain
VSDFIAFLESLPPAPLYAIIGALAAVENVFPPVPADVAVALGAFLAGRGVMNPWSVFFLTWACNTGSGALVYWFGRHYGRAFFAGRLGRRLLPPAVQEHVQRAYQRYGAFGIFFSRLLPVWRGVVMPFAGVAGVSAPRALVPLAAASAVYYGGLTLLVATLGTNLDSVLHVIGRLNKALAILAAAAVLVVIVVVVVRRRQT